MLSALLIAIGSAGVAIALMRYERLQNAATALPLWFMIAPALAAAFCRPRLSARHYFVNGAIASLALAIALGVAVDDKEHTLPTAFIEWFTAGLILSLLGLLVGYIAIVVLKAAAAYRWKREH